MDEQVSILVNYVEEHLRASETAGLEFVDPRSLRRTLQARQNHAVMGRRGSGKSSFVKALKSVEAEQSVAIYINLETYKDISFPNIILHVLRACFLDIQANLRLRRWWRLRLDHRIAERKLSDACKRIDRQLAEPDRQDLEVRTMSAKKGGLSAGARTDKAEAKVSSEATEEKEISRVDTVDKLAQIKLNIEFYLEVAQVVSSAFGETPVFLVLDDFYFLPKSVQPEFCDIFHRLTKGTNFFLKIATIKHRTKLYKQTSETYIGMEMGADVFEIDMDYTLDKFEDLKEFMKQLLDVAVRDSKANLAVEQLFAGGGFNQLCLASGGVPRDFLSLFVRVARRVLDTPEGRIGKTEVNEVAIDSLGNKMTSLKVDSAEERETLERYLAAIKHFVYKMKRTNVFLVRKSDLDGFSQERQAIRELVDLRLIHLVDSNTSAAPSDGQRYEAYMLDVSLYDNSRPRNFNQIEPGARDSHSRQDQLRAAPRLDLAAVKSEVEEQGPVQPLVTVDY